MTNAPKDNKETKASFAVIDDSGKEVPVTDEMIEEAIVNAKPQSIGKHTLPEMPVITDEMLKQAGKQVDDDN